MPTMMQSSSSSYSPAVVYAEAIDISEAFSSSSSSSSDNDLDQQYSDLPTVCLDDEALNEIAEEDTIPTVTAEDYSDPEFDDVLEAFSIVTGNVPAQEVLGLSSKEAEETYFDVDDCDSDDTVKSSKVPGHQRNHYATARAEYISASFIRPRENEDDPEFLGLRLSPTSENTILHIRPGSPAHRSPLRVGDKLISINHRACSQMSHAEIMDTLQNTPGMITLVVHNEGGAPDVVESMITKLAPDAKIGIGIKKHAGSELCNLFIGNINPHLGAMHSLLNPTDDLLSVNGIDTRTLTQLEAVQIISQATSTVTIKVITAHSTGVVLGEVKPAPPTPQPQVQQKQRTALPAWLQNAAAAWQQPQQRQHHRMIRPTSASTNNNTLVPTAA